MFIQTKKYYKLKKIFDEKAVIPGKESR